MFPFLSVWPFTLYLVLTLSVPSSKTLECDEESKESEWSTIEHPVFEEEDTIFHPDDEIIIDTKDPSDPPIKRVISFGYFDI